MATRRSRGYMTVGIMLLLLSLMLFGCSSEEKDFSKNNASEDILSSAPQEKLPTKEILLEESEGNNVEAKIMDINLEDYFNGLNGAAVLYRPFENSYQIYNQETALTQRSPCSTFKIISSLIALENGIIKPENSTRAWSGEVFWNEAWNKDIAFEEAFRTSCVWYYRELIDELGKDIVQKELKRLHYGNCDISDWEGRLNTNNNNRALTGFWIESSLKISPKEQVEVMERIFGECSVYTPETQSNLKRVMLVSAESDSVTSIYGKTGMGKSNGITVDAWFTGFAETAEGKIYFCIYLGETDEKNVSSARAKEIAIELLSNLEEVQ